MIHNTLGLIHVITAIASLTLGTCVLAMRKGTKMHKAIGYGYIICMAALNGTALSIYHLFGTWGPFHYAAVLSTSTVMMGFIPAFFRINHWVRWHVAGMYYSAIGLYAALVSEVVTRIPGLPFFTMVTIGTLVVMLIGVLVFYRHQKKWISNEQKILS